MSLHLCPIHKGVPEFATASIEEDGGPCVEDSEDANNHSSNIKVKLTTFEAFRFFCLFQNVILWELWFTMHDKKFKIGSALQMHCTNHNHKQQ